MKDKTENLSQIGEDLEEITTKYNVDSRIGPQNRKKTLKGKPMKFK